MWPLRVAQPARGAVCKARFNNKSVITTDRAARDLSIKLLFRGNAVRKLSHACRSAIHTNGGTMSTVIPSTSAHGPAVPRRGFIFGGGAANSVNRTLSCYSGWGFFAHDRIRQGFAPIAVLVDLLHCRVQHLRPRVAATPQFKSIINQVFIDVTDRHS